MSQHKQLERKMEAIFEKPIILDGEKDDVVLVYSKYIIWNVKKEITDLIIEGIDKDLLNTARFECLVKIKEVFAYKFEPDSDSHITFFIKNITGTSFRTIDFKDTETTKQAEIFLTEQFIKLGFKRNEKHITPTKAAISPLIVTAIIAGAGSLLTWFSYQFQKYGEQTETSNCSFNLFMKLCRGIGYIPFLIITTIITIFCFYWMAKRITNPPCKVFASK